MWDKNLKQHLTKYYNIDDQTYANTPMHMMGYEHFRPWLSTGHNKSYLYHKKGKGYTSLLVSPTENEATVQIASMYSCFQLGL